MDVKEALKSSGIDGLEAEVLLAHALGKNREWLMAHPEEEIDQAEYEVLLERRKTNEPVAYITESQDFYGRDYFVDNRVLIPRDSTERIVDLALDLLKDREDCVRQVDLGVVGFAKVFGNVSDVHTVVDICTGSGCIAITLALETDMNIIATDISQDALDVAKRNAKTHGVEDRIDFRLGNLTEPIQDLEEPFLVVTNPPYVPDEDELMEDVKDFEPHLALFGGPTGSDLVVQIYNSLQQNNACKGCVIECRTTHLDFLA
ncbi:MAG: peptide chain release factor N(5)-glutamine methyltransferase [Candidatus Peribacter sp.]|jgi:release factor glutamine methyltransferase|nr:peptide chain release factor N(5)-glutamine methyltransferase [Candidatus Peribacter sp.]MBT4392475.1 peptide chain release factor N(5)-glutamine methyltransferase [Candidatus Peribacter sp.]MBT4601304.1 peptide chain release factor N(5)-glutamine methyltransferase [Candidatus Peribacter sp.]MBT5149244.1 peptide chain release factor N(5)-glutamine methyltransferase [Candidatus Peribacter sp.]MBT5638030.1 peptide chain release factor N(5)-glutamine methyltransferase [Candidatus Peribacter sp.